MLKLKNLSSPWSDLVKVREACADLLMLLCSNHNSRRLLIVIDSFGFRSTCELSEDDLALIVRGLDRTVPDHVIECGHLVQERLLLVCIVDCSKLVHKGFADIWIWVRVLLIGGPLLPRAEVKVRLKACINGPRDFQVQATALRATSACHVEALMGAL